MEQVSEKNAGVLQVKGQRKRVGWFPADYVTLLGYAATSLQTTQLTVSL